MEWDSFCISNSQVHQSLQMTLSIKFDDISMFLLQAKENSHKEMQRADRIQQRLMILKKENEDASFLNIQILPVT